MLGHLFIPLAFLLLVDVVLVTWGVFSALEVKNVQGVTTYRCSGQIWGQFFELPQNCKIHKVFSSKLNPLYDT